ncbi:MAG TPA: CRISPR-associated endoribonuclease Cas6, partial [Firmicutes bacterium]|nr:CRISPR-associated endoribonuclease Cas6 [Bacillota bacterium]
MHFFISFKALENDVCLPFHYNHIVQSLIYNSIEPELASFLHEKGFVHQKRLFKLFSFSNLRGRYAIDRERGLICFQEKVDLVVSSPVEEFCQSLVNTLLTKNTVRIGAADVQVEKIFVNKYPVPGENISIYTLS